MVNADYNFHLLKCRLCNNASGSLQPHVTSISREKPIWTSHHLSFSKYCTITYTETHTRTGCQIILHIVKKTARLEWKKSQKLPSWPWCWDSIYQAHDTFPVTKSPWFHLNQTSASTTAAQCFLTICAKLTHSKANWAVAVSKIFTTFSCHNKVLTTVPSCSPSCHTLTKFTKITHYLHYIFKPLFPDLASGPFSELWQTTNQILADINTIKKILIYSLNR